MQQSGKLAAAPLTAPSANHHHVHIHQRSKKFYIHQLNDGLADHYAMSRLHCPSHVTEDPQRVVIPAAGNALAEGAAHKLDTAGSAVRTQERTGSPVHTRSLEQDTTKRRMRCQHARQERTTPTGNADPLRLAKGICRRNGRGISIGERIISHYC